jgi:hypothetical protein
MQEQGGQVACGEEGGAGKGFFLYARGDHVG